MSTANQASDDNIGKGADEQSSASGRQGATSRSTNQQMHLTRPGDQSSESEHRKVIDETDGNQGNVTEIRTARGRSRRDDDPPLSLAATVPSAQTSDPSTIGVEQQHPLLPHGVIDETGGEHDERGNTILTLNSITAENVQLAGDAVSTANDAIALANDTAQSDPKAAQELLKNARNMLGLAGAAIAGARNSHNAAVAAKQRHDQEIVLADELLATGVREACTDLCDSAQRTEDLSVPEKEQAVTLWERADAGLETLGACIKPGVLQIHVEIPFSAIGQAVVHVGTYLDYIWQLVMKLAERALLRLVWMQYEALLKPFLLPHIA